MAVAYVSKGAISNALTNSLTPSLPASVTAGNYLFLHTDNTGGLTPTTPAGWTLLSEQISSPNGYRSQVYYKVASGSDTDPNLAFSSNTFVKAQVFQYSGVLSVGATSSNKEETAGANHTCPAITSTATDSTAIYLHSSGHNVTISAPSGWTGDSSDGSTYGAISAGSKSLGASGSSSGTITISDADANYYFIWNIELKAAPVPIDAPAESTSSASAETVAGYGIAAPAESTASGAADASYIFTIGAFGNSSASLTSIAERIFYGSGIVSSSAVITGQVSLIWEANIIVEAIASVVGAVIGARNTTAISESSAVASDSIHGFFIIDASASSSGEFTSTADILRSLAAAASSAAAVSGNTLIQSKYYLLAESIANVIDGIQYVNDYWDGWAFNINNEAPSFYENFKFNSFAKLGNNYYGMASDGIHLLSGENDNGVDINSLIRTGSDDYDDTTIKTIPVVYASARSNKEMILNAKVDDNHAYDYTFIGKPGEIAPVRVKLGRGLRGRNWQIEIRNKDGAYIEIDQLDIPSVSTSRRV